MCGSEVQKSVREVHSCENGRRGMARTRNTIMLWLLIAFYAFRVGSLMKCHLYIHKKPGYVLAHNMTEARPSVFWPSYLLRYLSPHTIPPTLPW